MLHINNKNIPPGKSEINICGSIIKSSATARFLGIVFDYKLTFTPHIDMLIKKCAIRANIIKFLCGVKWGSHPSTLISLYKSFVRSVIDYGCFVTFPKTIKYSNALEKIQLSCLRQAMGYRNSTPTNVILAESKLQSISECTKFLCRCFLTKVLSNSSLYVYNTIHFNYHYVKNSKKTNLYAY